MTPKVPLPVVRRGRVASEQTLAREVAGAASGGNREHALHCGHTVGRRSNTIVTSLRRQRSRLSESTLHDHINHGSGCRSSSLFCRHADASGHLLPLQLLQPLLFFELLCNLNLAELHLFTQECVESHVSVIVGAAQAHQTLQERVWKVDAEFVGLTGDDFLDTHF